VKGPGISEEPPDEAPTVIREPQRVDPFVADLRGAPEWEAVLNGVRISHHELRESLGPLPTD